MKLKEKLSAKLKNQKGFTLIEMLIVVAIIAILIFISIPMVTNTLEEAKKATDDANLRAAKGAATIQYLTTGTIEGVTATSGGVAYYDYESGEVVSTTEAKTIEPYRQSNENTGEVVKITLSSTGELSYAWANRPA